MTLMNLVNSLSASEPLVHIYGNKLVLNSKAVQLLGINQGCRVAVRYTDRTTQDGKKRLYMGRVTDGGFIVRFRGQTAVIYSTALCKKMTEQLQGAGTYKLSGEDVEKDFYGNPHYNVFWKRYD